MHANANANANSEPLPAISVSQKDACIGLGPDNSVSFQIAVPGNVPVNLPPPPPPPPSSPNTWVSEGQCRSPLSGSQPPGSARVRKTSIIFPGCWVGPDRSAAFIFRTATETPTVQWEWGWGGLQWGSGRGENSGSQKEGFYRGQQSTITRIDLTPSEAGNNRLGDCGQVPGHRRAAWLHQNRRYKRGYIYGPGEKPRLETDCGASRRGYGNLGRSLRHDSHTALKIKLHLNRFNKRKNRTQNDSVSS